MLQVDTLFYCGTLVAQVVLELGSREEVDDWYLRTLLRWTKLCIPATILSISSLRNVNCMCGYIEPLVGSYLCSVFAQISHRSEA